MGYDIEVRDMPPRRAVAVREKTTGKAMGQAMRQLYPVVSTFLEKRGVEPGEQFAIYHSYSEEEVDFEAGYMVTEPVEGEGRVEVMEVPAMRAAVAVHVGPYTTIGKAHEALDEWIHAQGSDHAEAVWEIYLVGPGQEEDSSNWRTEVVYPLG